MWPFSSKSLPIADLPAIVPDEFGWGLFVVDDDGPMMIRVNDSAKDWCGHPSLPIKLGFAIPLSNPNPSGMPDPDENVILSDIEDAIKSAVQKVTFGIHVLTNTNGIMKEFVFYIPKGVDIQTLHESLDDSVATHDIQCIAEIEPKWPTYKAFRQLALSGKSVM